MSKLLIRSRYSPRERKGLSFKGTRSRTKQSFAKEADINNIMAQYVKTGLMPQGHVKPSYGDFSSGDDFRSVMDRILIAEAEFGRLPSDIRKRFLNDPAELLNFLSDPNNEEEAITLGLIPGKADADSPAAIASPPAEAEPGEAEPASE